MAETPKPRRDPDEERDKPCGYVGYCPLVDENRFYFEGQYHLQIVGFEYRDGFPLLNLTLRKWCKGLAARGVSPRPQECRAVLARALQELDRPDGASAVLSRALTTALADRERADRLSARKVGASLFPMADPAPF